MTAAAKARSWESDTGPAERRRSAAIIEAQRISQHVSRSQFKAFPLEWIIVTSLDAPVLLFEILPGDDPERVRDARGLQERLHCAEEGRGLGLCDAYRRTHDPVKRAVLAREIRRRWSDLVELAVGYTFPGWHLGGASMLLEFEPEASA